MSSVSALRDGIAAQLALVPDLRVSATFLDAPRPPVAMVLPDGIDYDLNANRGADTFTFIVSLLVGRADDRAAQRNIDVYVVGPDSVKAAIEQDRTLGGAANTCRVTQMRNYGQVSVGDVVYLGVEFEVEVVA
jgi:cellobiose-specific phosphotransferase system component IIB